MKVLYIHQYFKTPSEGGSLRSYNLAKELVKNGQQVTMITAHHTAQRRCKNVDGIEVVYLPVAYSNHMSFGRRGIAFLRFMLLAMLESLRHREVDLCYVMTTPLSTGIVALFNKYMLRRRYIFEVGDLWPKIPIDMGLIKSSWKANLLTWLEQLFYRKASGLVGLSGPIARHLQAKAPGIPVETIFNLSDCETMKPKAKNRSWIQKYKTADQFVVSYTGTFGLANDLSRLILWAESIQDLPVLFLLVGQGAEKQKIESLIKSKQLRNVRTYDHMAKSEIEEVINISDALFISFADVASLHTGSPNKFFDALAAGKPVISNFGGWIGELIESEKCGFVVEDQEDLRKYLELLMNDQSVLQRYGEKSRKLAEEKFDLNTQAKKQLNFLNSLIKVSSI